MAKIYVGGAGGAPSNNFISSLKLSGRDFEIVGGSSSSTDLFLADVERGYLVPNAGEPDYAPRLLSILADERPDMIHAQHDYEVLAVSELRDEIHALGVKTLLPARETVRTCVDKFLSYSAWEAAGVRVPRTLPIEDEAALERAFRELGPRVWLRATTGAAGRGALPTDDLEFARMWIGRFDGWGEFTASECLTAATVTWSSLWFDGELVAAQTRQRHGWSFGNRALSGVTGITAVGETATHPVVDEVALGAILAIDRHPNGIFSVDMTYDDAGYPRPTEINIGRFFTTHLFFAAAGLNLPEIYCDLALEGRRPWAGARVNPLPDGLIWIRGMDTPPKLTTRAELDRLEREGVLRRSA